MRLLDLRNVILLSYLLLHLIVNSDPIEKEKRTRPNYARPPSLIPVPEEIREGYVFGNSNAPGLISKEDGEGESTQRLELRDQVCESKANTGCRSRCISLEEQCFCATNGDTYRNQCEMSCMRKILREKINWSHFGKCEPVCSSERIDTYKTMVKDLLMIEYLKKNVKRCEKLVRCKQAKLVMDYTEGNQTVSECPRNLPAFLLFSGLDCSDMLQLKLQRVFEDEPSINCAAAKIVNNKLLNDKNCARSRKGPNEKKLIQWSFDMLDKNVDRHLMESELNILLKIPDHECGETFFSSCDEDHDGYVREDEWSRCLGCEDCYRPCFVFKSKREERDRTRRFIQSVISCTREGYCNKRQCERQFNRHENCWCVDEDCNEIPGTKSYARRTC